MRPSVTKRLLAVSIVIAIATLFSGCVYLRLLDLKGQLANFHEYVLVEESDDGLRLVLKEPTVRDQDLLRLGVRPLHERQTETGSVWDIAMRKRYPSPQKEDGDFDLQLQAEFVDGMLTAVFMPRDYLGAFPPEFVIDTMQALGQSKVLKLKRSVDATCADDDGKSSGVSLAELKRTLGVPYEQASDGGEISVTYRYSKMTPEWVNDPRGPQKIYHITFVFDREDGELLSAATRSISVRYAKSS